MTDRRDNVRVTVFFYTVKQGILYRKTGNTVNSRLQCRYTLYRHVIAYMYGHLVKGNRREIPQCVLTDIHDITPEKDKKDYTGHRESSVN